MTVSPDDLVALEERLLAKLQPSRVEESDLPAAVYSRVMYLTAALLIYVCASMLVGAGYYDGGGAPRRPPPLS